MRFIATILFFSGIISFSQTNQLEVYLSRNDSNSLEKLFNEGVNIDTAIDNKQSLLSLACARGKLQMVKFLLNQGADIEHEASFREKPLYYAAKNDHFKIVKYLVSAGASTDPGFFNRSPVEAAAQNGNFKMVKYLTEKGFKQYNSVKKATGSDKNEMIKYLIDLGGDPSDAIVRACENGDLKMVKYLVERGANIKEREKRRRGFLKGKYYVTPFERAVYGNHKEVAMYLVSKGLNKEECFKEAYSKKENQAISKAILAQMTDYSPVIFLPVFKDDLPFLKEMLLKKEELIYAKNKDGKSLLHEAILSKSINVFDYLIAKKEIINSKDEKGITPLMLVAKEGNAEMYTKIITSGGDKIMMDNNQNNLLHYAAIGGNLEILVLVLEQKIDIHKKNKDGNTPVMLAAKSSKTEAVKLLYSNNANLEETDKLGNNLLHFASKNGDLKLTEYLIEKGLNPQSKNKLDLTPLAVATKNGHRKLIDYYGNKGMTNLNVKDDKGYTPMMRAIKNCDFQEVKRLHELGANINNINPYGKTIPCFKEEVVKYIVENGGEIDKKMSSFNETYLFKAVDRGRYDLAKFLLKNGADPNTKNTFDRPPLYEAISDKNLEMVKLLVENKANVNALISNWGDKNILSHAIYKEDKRIIEYLKEKGAILPGEKNKEPKQAPAKSDLLKGVKYQNIKLVEQAISTPSKFTLSEKEKEDVLAFVFIEKHDQLLKYLITNKVVSANYSDKFNGESLLIMLVKNSSSTSIIETILRSGAEIDGQDKKKKTALIYAAENNNLELVKYFAEHGADLNKEDMYGKKAINYGNRSIKNYLKSIR